MIFPKMILFDYGHTLLYEPDFDSKRGNAAVMKHIIKNPHGYGLDEITQAAQRVFGELQQLRSSHNYDIGARVGDRLMYGQLGIEIGLTPLEMENTFWDAATQGAIMPDAQAMLTYLRVNHIRSGVISNMLWSSDALARRINRLLPDNDFEFVMASSDYLYRKPSHILFDIALEKAELQPKDVWYCGDNPLADVDGAAGAGIFPVWYDNDTEKDSKPKPLDYKPKAKHLYVKEWREVIEALETLKAQ